MELLYADRSGRGKLRFSGEQDLWFLDQILTQSFDPMAVGETREAAMLTPHGRMVGYAEFVRTEEAVLAHVEADLEESFPEALRRYVFATRVEIEDVGDTFELLLLVGDGWDEAAAGAAPDAVRHATLSLGVPAGYLWIPAGKVRQAIEGLVAAGAKASSEEELEAIRIANGVPRWGYEMDFKTIPQEAGIHEWAVAFDKGCYLGQEAMAKIHFRGKVNRRLARLTGADLTVGAEVQLDGSAVGRVTSVSNGNALAIVKHTVEPGATVTIEDHQASVTA